jgi:hypothetical protein
MVASIDRSTAGIPKDARFARCFKDRWRRFTISQQESTQIGSPDAICSKIDAMLGKLM